MRSAAAEQMAATARLEAMVTSTVQTIELPSSSRRRWRVLSSVTLTVDLWSKLTRYEATDILRYCDNVLHYETVDTTFLEPLYIYEQTFGDDKQSSMGSLSTICFVLFTLGIHLTFAEDLSQLVTKLPGQPSVRFRQFAGQVTVNSTTGKALFYWFYEADDPKPASLPLVLWLNGGPGCSSVGAGALGELGPFRPSATGLNLNPHAWNKAANIIFLEAPVGVGFSYSNSSSDYNTYNDAQTATDNLQFLIEWFGKFPEYAKNDFYVVGESYAGHYIPTLASRILAYNTQGGHLNFKGFAIGNPWTAAAYETRGNLEFLYTHSIISDETYKEAVQNCFSSNGDSVKCSVAQGNIDMNTQFINPYNVYDNGCGVVLKTLSKELTYKERLGRVYDTCKDTVSAFLNSADVQEALHVVNRPVQWSTCNFSVRFQYSDEDFTASVIPVYQQLLKSGIRIWIYSGDFDSVVSTLSTRSWIKVLNLTIDTTWYPWSYQGQVGGWTQVYSNLLFTTVRGAGHMVPKDQPGPALALFQSFLAGKPLPAF